MVSQIIRKTPDRLTQRQFVAFILNFLAVFFVYNAMLLPHFSPDTFAAYKEQPVQVFIQISSGRIVHGLLFHLLYLCGLGVLSHLSAYTVLFMLVSSWCTMRISSVLCNRTPKNNDGAYFVCNFIVLISIINICVFEWYLFTEAMLMYSLALLGATESALIFARDLPLRRRMIISFVWLFVAMNSYQALLGWYVALSLTAILTTTDFRLNKRAFGLGVAALLIGGINSILNQGIVKLAQISGIIEGTERQMVVNNLFNKIGVIYENQRGFLRNGYYLMPAYFLCAAIFLGILMLFLALHKKKLVSFFSIGVALGMGYLLTLIPHLMSPNILITPRTLSPVFLIIALMLALAFVCGGKNVRLLCVSCAAYVLLVNASTVSSAITDHRATILADLEEGRAIIQEIQDYEKTNDAKIDEICVLHDAAPHFSFPGVKASFIDINTRQMTVDWEREPFLETLSGRDFTFIDLSEQEAEAIVQGRNWNYADYGEQISFDGNRAYVILY